MSFIELTTKGREKVLRIQADLQRHGFSTLCPGWVLYNTHEESITFYDECKMCKELFPKITHYKCPCSKYEEDTLIKMLDKILEQNGFYYSGDEDGY